ncbi:MAG: transposase [Eubacteriales bacterium]|nr:transposase [Eubacteriales bacterium]
MNKKYPGDYEKRKQLRLEKEKPILEAFRSWLDQQKPFWNTRMDKAVNCVQNRHDTTETYLEDGRCSFTNNLSLSILLSSIITIFKSRKF